MNVLIVNLTSGETHTRPLDDPLAGGRLLTAQLVSEFAPPQCDPLGAENVLVLAAGPLANMRASTGSRLSIGCKSPLTKGIKEANAGGMAGDSLAGLGLRAVVFLGALPDGGRGVVVLDETGFRLDFESAAACWGRGNEETVTRLLNRYGKDWCALSIGQAGEQRMTAAGIAVTDAEGNPYRLAARGGVGAVMGSKGLKAILLARPDRAGKPLEQDARVKVSAFNKYVASSERVQVLRDYGTASTVMLVQSLGGLPVRNFSKGQLPDAGPLSGENMRSLILQRKGSGLPSHACMKGCVIQCSNVFPDEKGDLLAAPLEFETLGLCGSNLELDSLDEIAEINRLCNDYGLDTIEVGAALGVMMEAASLESLPAGINRDDLPKFGDNGSAMRVLEQVPQNTRLGRLLGDGAFATGKALGVRRIPIVKGQAISAYDPRVVKGTGVTYATSPQGADHTAGLTVFFPVEHRDPKNAVSLSRKAQIQRAAYDALGLCAFNTSATGQRPDIVLDMLASVYQTELPGDWMDVLGLKVIRLERGFNKAAGLTEQDDRLPQFFKTEALVEPASTVFDVTDAELDAIWD